MMQLIFNVIRRIRRVIFHFTNPISNWIKKYLDFYYLSYYGVETKPGYVKLLGRPIIHKHPQARIIVGEYTTLISKSKYNSAGINHPVILASLREGSVLHIHGSFGASGSAIVAMSSIEIEEGVALGANAHVYDTDFHSIGFNITQEGKTFPVRLCKKVWVAANSIVLKGVTIGENSVIAAGSVVSKSVEPNAIYGGVPAIKIKNI